MDADTKWLLEREKAIMLVKQMIKENLPELDGLILQLVEEFELKVDEIGRY